MLFFRLTSLLFPNVCLRLYNLSYWFTFKLGELHDGIVIYILYSCVCWGWGACGIFMYFNDEFVFGLVDQLVTSFVTEWEDTRCKEYRNGFFCFSYVYL